MAYSNANQFGTIIVSAGWRPNKKIKRRNQTVKIGGRKYKTIREAHSDQIGNAVLMLDRNTVVFFKEEIK